MKTDYPFNAGSFETFSRPRSATFSTSYLSAYHRNFNSINETLSRIYFSIKRNYIRSWSWSTCNTRTKSYFFHASTQSQRRNSTRYSSLNRTITSIFHGANYGRATVSTACQSTSFGWRTSSTQSRQNYRRNQTQTAKTQYPGGIYL